MVAILHVKSQDINKAYQFIQKEQNHKDLKTIIRNQIRNRINFKIIITLN